tara:strand:+ start:71373 stop:72476 length:1104 start_codon:yes stop_codon:yes gene_type:complete
MGKEISYKKPTNYEFTREEVIQLVYKKRKKLLLFVLVALVIGIISVMLTPREYQSSAIIVPQISSSPSVNKKYSKIAALAGINLKTNESPSLLPTVYPIIISSTPFRKEILQTPLKFNGVEDTITLSYYLDNLKKTPFIDKVKKYTIGLPGLIINSLKSKPAVMATVAEDSTLNYLSARELSQFGFLEESVTINFNDIDGYIEVVGRMPEPIASAQLTKRVHELLQNYIIEYNIEKSQDELVYLEGRLEEAEKSFFSKRAIYGNYLDSNRNIISSYSQNRADQYKIEYELAHSIYAELSSQLETAKLQVKKDTPIFTIIKPVTVPVEPVSRNAIVTIGLCVFLGTVAALIVILFNYSKQFIRHYVSS